MLKCSVIVVFIALATAGNARADVSNGAVLSEQLCSQCHAVKPGQSSPRSAAPTFPSVAADPSITELSLRAFLRTPHWTMPNIIVKPDDMDDIASYIVSLKPKQ
jgi:mono/diheme cytochrome c family protein